MTETNRIEYKRELTPELDIEKDIVAFLNYKEDEKVYLLNVKRFVSDKQVDSYSKSLKIGDYL